MNWRRKHLASELLIHGVFLDGPVNLEAVYQAFGSGVTLGFMPKSIEGFSVEQYHGEDTLFVKCKIFVLTL